MARREVCLCSKEAEDPYIVFAMEDELIMFDPETMDYGLLLKMGNVFPSVSQAWKHGYKGPVPYGFLDFICYGCEVYVYNPMPERFGPPEDHPPEQYRKLYSEIMDSTTLDLSKPVPEMVALRDRLEAGWLTCWRLRFNDIDLANETMRPSQKRQLKFKLLTEIARSDDEKAYGVWCIAIQ